jgi:hypothetical protein
VPPQLLAVVLAANLPTNNNHSKETTVSNFWSDPELEKAAKGAEYFKFLEVGDTVSGTIRDLRKVDFDGRTAVEVTFDDDSKATFGQVLMLRQLYILQPTPGDQLTVTLSAVDKKGAKTLKLFTGKIVRPNGDVEEFDQTK